jgi:cell division transport system permease protein
LPAALQLLVDSLGAASYRWQGSLQESLFLKDSVDAERGQALAAQLAARPGVAQAEYISRERALEEFRRFSGYGDALDALEDNPLPAVIAITPAPQLDHAQTNALFAQLAQLPEVESAKYDQKWLDRLYAAFDFARRVVAVVAALLAVSVLMVVGNTVRLEIAGSREEIGILKLLGASDRFIRRPFLYAGVLYGLLGGLFAGALTLAALVLLAEPLRTLLRISDTGGSETPVPVGALALIFALGAALGWGGTYWTVSRELRTLEPR